MNKIKPNDRTSVAPNTWSARKVLLRTALGGALCGLAIQPTPLCAQQPAQQSPLYSHNHAAGLSQQSLHESRTLSLRKRVEMLQGNVKRKLQSALGVDPNAIPVPHDDADAHWIQESQEVPKQYAPKQYAPSQYAPTNARQLQPMAEPTAQRAAQRSVPHSTQRSVQHSAQNRYDRVHESPFDTYVANQESSAGNDYLRDPQPVQTRSRSTHHVSSQDRNPDFAAHPEIPTNQWNPPQSQTAWRSTTESEPGSLYPVQVVTAENIPATHFQDAELQPVQQSTMRRVQYRQPYVEPTPPLPPPHPSQDSISQHAPGEPIRRWDDTTNVNDSSPAGNHQSPGRSRFRTASAPVDNSTPLPRGTILGEPQMTATQHALRLLEENGDIKAQLAMLKSENERLKEKLEQSESLLSRSTQAVESAHQELETLTATNRDLQKQLDSSQQRYNRYLKETDRMLQSIREELDDVLVREISAKGT